MNCDITHCSERTERVIPEKRIGNIAYRHNQGGEIVCYYPNPYYKKEKDYEWDEDRKMYKASDHFHIHKDCFKGKENCYVLAFVRMGEASFDLKTVCLRPWELNDEDTEDFKTLLRWMGTYGLD